MRYTSALAGALTALLALTFAMPGHADRDNDHRKDWKEQGNDPSVVCASSSTGDTQDDTRTFQAWYGQQLRGYEQTDRETGARLCDLLQMITEVSGNRLIVVNQADTRRQVTVTDRTQVVFQLVNAAQSSWERRDRNYQPGAFIASRLRPGDLAIVEGYLHVSGSLVATRIRVVGHARGWDDETYQSPVDYGYRGYGEIRSVDERHNRIDVNGKLTPHALTLTAGAEVQVDGRQEDIYALRRGDRIVYYARYDSGVSLDVYRVVRLRADQAYPKDDHPYWADPDNGSEQHGDRDTTLEGRLNAITSGLFLMKIAVRTELGRNVTVYASKGLMAIGRDGNRVSILRLRAGDQLRIAYTEFNGNLFATRIDIR